MKAYIRDPFLNIYISRRNKWHSGLRATDRVGKGLRVLCCCVVVFGHFMGFVDIK